MIARLAAFSFLVALAAVHPVWAETVRIVYLGVEDDPHYEPQPAYTGLSLRDLHRPLEGARLGFRDTRVLGRAIGTDFVLEDRLLAAGEDAAEAVRAIAESGALATLLDLPDEDLAKVWAVPAPPGILIDLRSSDMRWRDADCASPFLHVAPSAAMLSDALAQYLRYQGWTRILILHGETAVDLAEVATARASITKFGLDIAETRPFVLSNDPRERDRNNIALLTGGVRYDVVWLIDTVGDFGRFVPYATFEPRPVVGTEGLSPHAWHWTLERYGAPQLNQRFRRLAGRDMTSEDWAGWVAVRAIVDAIALARSTAPDAVASAIRSPDLGIDLYKGVRGNFRPWNGQLRQPILLATHNAVIAIAPLDGFEHQKNTLDTLGIDEPEGRC